MTGMTTAESLRIELAQLATQHAGIPVRYVDDVCLPVDDGRYISLVLCAGGAAAEVLVFTTENFYHCLRKVMVAALPSMGHLASS